MLESGLKIGPLHIRLPISIYGFAALGLIALGAGIRIALLAQGWPHTNSDEGTYGMMAINIAFHGDHPIFMYGQNYMGSIQAYIAAGVFHLFGISMLHLRIGLVFLFALFLYSMYLLTSLLYSKGMALFTLLLLCLGSSYVIYRQIQAVGGWTETLFFGALLYFIASWLALPVKRNPSQRLGAYFGWSLLVGLCLWSDVVVATFTLTSGLLLLNFCRREICTIRVLAALVVGVLLGGLPMILYNLHTTLLKNSLLTAVGIFDGGMGHSSILYLLAHGTLGMLLIGIPAITSDSSICDVSHILFLGGAGPDALQCTLIQGMWSLAWIALWVSSVYLSVKSIRALPHKIETRTFEQQQTQARSYARLGLLIAAAISLFLFAISAASTYSPFLSSRYILFIWIATPCLIYPLWLGASVPRTSGGGFARFINIDAKRLALLTIAVLFLWGTVKTFQDIPATQAVNAQQEDFIDNLAHIGAFHIYSDYWTCERIMFQSAGQITCYTVDDSLNEGRERYPANKTIVTSDPKSSWAFPTNLPQAKAIAQHEAQLGKLYRRYEFDGYVVYQPM